MRPDRKPDLSPADAPALHPIVLIIDDDPYIRESLENLLRSVGLAALSFESTHSFLEAKRPDAPGCLVLDVRLPGRSGLEFQRELAELGVGIPLIFITGHGDIPMSVSAMKAGAIEFLTKPFRDQDFLDAVQRGIDTDRSRREAAAAMSDLRARYRLLTGREREVMALVASGQLNKQIAATLQLSEITVKVHRAQVMNKLQAKSLPELVRIADRLAADGGAAERDRHAALR
ncbi:response regulator transcription factor [Azospirillum sp. SYSU D00513]|uniref:response regulator transcription factor n=1 Tax=Azospirillum sp. SYSU D00513 TaxID=2812561 RepID=UPI001A96A1DA|nr:response regulator transcription factor [Azospirillum sp. SYSU D00513]